MRDHFHLLFFFSAIVSRHRPLRLSTSVRELSIEQAKKKKKKQILWLSVTRGQGLSTANSNWG